jgi:hypothetical protein
MFLSPAKNSNSKKPWSITKRIRIFSKEKKQLRQQENCVMLFLHTIINKERSHYQSPKTFCNLYKKEKNNKLNKIWMNSMNSILMKVLNTKGMCKWDKMFLR